MPSSKNRLRELPSIDRVLSSAAGQQLIARYRRDYVTRRCRELIGELRASILGGHTADEHELSEAAILARLEQRIRAERDTSLTRVVNATGTVLHTNLGRALLPRAAIEALTASAGNHINLEYDLAHGARGRREDAVERLLIELTGAEAATVVNNNAAAIRFDCPRSWPRAAPH